MSLDEIKVKLEKYGQEHLLLSYDRLDEEGKEKLLRQIENINFDECNELYALTKETKKFDNTNYKVG